MGLRTGRPNRLKWNTAEMLNVLAHATSEREVVQAFREMPAAEKLDLLVRLSDSAAMDRAEGGPDRVR